MNRPPLQALSKKRNLSARPDKSRRRGQPQLYSPRNVADAIGVSESSLKRWCDAGYVKATKTAGGHRRVTRAEVIAFIKRKNYPLRDPMAIGLPDLGEVSIVDDADAREQLLAALLQEDEEACKRLLVYLFLQGKPLPALFDHLISPVFETIGRKWQSGELEVYQERMACQCCFHSLLEVRSLIEPTNEGAPLALGCSLDGDHYQLPTLGVELCLATHGWKAASLGSNIPIESLLSAVETRMPRLVWIALGHVADPDMRINQLNAFQQQLPARTQLIVGGHGLSNEMKSRLHPSISCCENYAQMIVATMDLQRGGRDRS